MTQPTNTQPKPNLLGQLARATRDLLRPRYHAQVSQQPKLAPIEEIVANAGREPPLAD
jgi:hypothetical protein